MLRNIVFIGGPRDGQSTWRIDPPPEIVDSDDARNNVVTFSHYHGDPDAPDPIVYRFTHSHDGPLSYAIDAIDHWIHHQFPEDFKGFAADVGAYDGFTGSNTFYLEELGWTCLCIEPNHNLQAPLRMRRALAEHCACASKPQESAPFFLNLDAPASFSGIVDPRSRPIEAYYSEGSPFVVPYDQQTVRVRTLNELLDSYGFPRLDALSLDTEGTELDVLDGLDLERWRPRVIVCESWNRTDPDCIPYLEQRGYHFIERRAVNNLFLREHE